MPDTALRLRRRLKAFSRRMRELRLIAKGALRTSHPIMAHIIPIRRCNLSCTYCNEFDEVSKPVPLEEMLRRIDRLAELVRHPRILDAVESVVGPDILVYTATFFIKEANSPVFAAWHQDATYFGLSPHEHVTAWVALTDASREAGCMEVVSSRGAPRQLAHAALGLAHSINGGGQAIVEEFDAQGSEMMALPQGSFSLHHTLCRHRSAPNRASHRRIGVGISYIPAHVRLTGSHRMCALLVRGRDTGGHFDLLTPPEGELHPAALARHENACRRYLDNYREQIERHEREFPAAASA